MSDGKPILIMPKKASLGEQRNEHQLATARRMKEMAKVSVAFDEMELREKLDRLDEVIPSRPIPPHAAEPLTGAIRAFIFERSAG